MLCTIYKEAIKKMNCEVSKIRVIQLDDGQFKAAIDVSVYPYSFSGDVAATKVAANSKLLFSVIKYVNIGLGQAIIDLNYSVRQCQDNFINCFNHEMNGIWRCGEKMQSLLSTCQDLFAKNTNEFTDKISGSACTMVVSLIQIFASQLLDVKVKFEDAWVRFMNLKVFHHNHISNMTFFCTILLFSLFFCIAQQTPRLSCC